MLFLYATVDYSYHIVLQIEVARRLLDVNESRFIRSCSFASACFPQSVFFVSFPLRVINAFKTLWFLTSLVVIFQPPVNQFSCNALLAWYFRQVVFGIECAGAEFIGLQFDFPAFIVGYESYH